MRKNPLRVLLNKLRWDPRFEESKVRIYYLHRTEEGEEFRILTLSEVEDLGSNFMILGDTMIPYHRIIRVEYGGRTLYLKASRSQGSREP